MRIALIGGVVLFGRLHRRRAPSVRLATSNSHGGSTGTGYRHPVPEPVAGCRGGSRAIHSISRRRSQLARHKVRVALRCVALRCVRLRQSRRRVLMLVYVGG